MNDIEQERIASAIEANVRHLLAVPADVKDVPRSLEAMDLEVLANMVRGGYYAVAETA